MTFARPLEAEDGEGIFVQIGIAGEEQGDFESLLAEQLSPEETVAEESGEMEENISQESEETIPTTPKEPEKKESKNDPAPVSQPQEDTRIQNQVANAFNKGLTGSGGNGSGSPGSPDGNSATGAASGSPGYGNYDLGGRGIIGTLPRPQYDNSNDEGTIVVSITVNPDGKVIAASLGKGSTGLAASNATLRQQAVEAAKKAVFSKSNRTGNQNGTITYYFRQR